MSDADTMRAVAAEIGPHLKAGAIVSDVGSVKGSIVRANQRAEELFGLDAPSAAAKRALRHVSQVLAMEEAAHGIRVNVICPGVVEETDLLEGAVPADKQTGFLTTFAGLHPLGRNGKPEDVADAVLFFASPLSRWITGAVLPVDGGYLIA